MTNNLFEKLEQRQEADAKAIGNFFRSLGMGLVFVFCVIPLTALNLIIMTPLAWVLRGCGVK